MTNIFKLLGLEARSEASEAAHTLRLMELASEVHKAHHDGKITADEAAKQLARLKKGNHPNNPSADAA